MAQRLTLQSILFLLFCLPPAFSENDLPVFITYNQKAIVTVKTELIETRPRTKPSLIVDPETKKSYLLRRRKMADYERNATGIIVTSSGYILVNTHTIAHAPKITVTLHDGKNYPARLVQKAKGYDLSLIKIAPSSPLHPVLWGNSENIEAQQKILVMTSPDKNPNVMQGKILAIQKSKDKNPPMVDAIELNVPLERGDSGSAVLDTDGKFMAMIAARSSHFKSHSFAIPSSFIREIFKKYLVQ